MCHIYMITWWSPSNSSANRWAGPTISSSMRTPNVYDAILYCKCNIVYGERNAIAFRSFIVHSMCCVVRSVCCSMPRGHNNKNKLAFLAYFFFLLIVVVGTLTRKHRYVHANGRILSINGRLKKLMFGIEAALFRLCHGRRCFFFSVDNTIWQW